MTSKESFFERELKRLGPQQPPAAWDIADAQAYCKTWAKQHYENFNVVSFLLPRRVRQDFYNVYAFCRWSDNLADEIDDPDESRRLLDWWQGQLSLCYSGRPAHPVLLALQTTIEEYHLPRVLFTDLLSAFRQDQQVTRYANESDLLDYCRRSADPVGRILLQIGRANDLINVAMSDQVCTGLQLANFCQDMSRDAAAGRIYAPRSLWERHQVSESELLNRKVTDPLRSMLADWVKTTRSYFYRGWPLVRAVPSWLSMDVDLFVRGGMAILDKIEAARFDVWTERPIVSRSLKLRLVCRSLVARAFGGRAKLGHTTLQNTVTGDYEARNIVRSEDLPEGGGSRP